MVIVAVWFSARVKPSESGAPDDVARKLDVRILSSWMQTTRAPEIGLLTTVYVRGGLASHSNIGKPVVGLA